MPPMHLLILFLLALPTLALAQTAPAQDLKTDASVASFAPKS